MIGRELKVTGLTDKTAECGQLHSDRGQSGGCWTWKEPLFTGVEVWLEKMGGSWPEGVGTAASREDRL